MAKTGRLALLGFALVLFLAPGRATVAEEAPWDLATALGAYVRTEDPAERLARALEIAHQAPDAQRVADALAGAWTWSDATPRGEVVTWKRPTPDGAEHTVYAYAPEAYTPAKAWPLLLWLHGGVSREEDGGGTGGISMFQEEADAKGFVILAPSTRIGAFWWSPAGVALVRDALRDALRRWRIDTDRIAVAGFSDGGSGCYHLLAHDPTPYACFLAMMGNPLVTRIQGGPTWAPTLASRPVWAVNGGRDRLYPSAQIQPFLEAMKAAGADLTWIDEPEAGHEPSFLEERWDEIHRFWMEHPRVAAPATIRWASSAPHHDGRFGWVEIRALAPHAPSATDLAAPLALEVPDLTPRPRLGIELDRAAVDEGLAILAVQEGTPAAEAGFQAGDRILKVGDEALAGPEAALRLREYLDRLGEEEGTFTVRRGDAEIVLRARPRLVESDRPVRPPDLGYDVAPGVVEAEALGGNHLALRTRGVAVVRLHLAPPLVDLDRELVVTLNGAERFRGLVPRDVAYLLAQAAQNGPAAPAYAASIDLTVAP